MEDYGRIRVLLVDDHRIFREALRMLLANDCEVIAEASDGEQAVALAVRLKPQVVVMDIGMRGIGGLSAARRIAREAPASKVLMLSEYQEEEYVLEALGDAGAAHLHHLRDVPDSDSRKEQPPCLHIAPALCVSVRNLTEEAS